MDDHRDTKLHELRRRVTTGEYRVDLGAVADAIVRRNGVIALAAQAAPSGAATLTGALAA